MTNLSVFNFESHEVRTLGTALNPLFVGLDICEVLGISNSRDALERLDNDEKDVVTIDTLGGKQRMTAITESGLYSLVLTSRKPQAKRFKKWLTSEVIPAIRKTGTYSIPAQQPAKALPSEYDIKLKNIRDAKNKLTKGIHELQVQIDTLKGEWDALDASEDELVVKNNQAIADDVIARREKMAKRVKRTQQETDELFTKAWGLKDE